MECLCNAQYNATEYIYETIEERIKSHIVAAKKITAQALQGGSVTTTYDKLLLLSAGELGNGGWVAGQNERNASGQLYYTTLDTTAERTMKKKNGYAEKWYLRTCAVNDDNCFMMISKNGDFTTISYFANTGGMILFGLCLR